MGTVSTRRNILIRQEYRLRSGRTVIVHDVPAQEVTIDGRPEADLTIAVVRQLEKLVERAVAESEDDVVELSYEPAEARSENPSSPRLSA